MEDNLLLASHRPNSSLQHAPHEKKKTMEVVIVYNCVECGEVITNPVCEERLALEFRTWLAETDSALEAKFTDEYVSRSSFMNKECGHQRCILTRKHMDICPYCATTQFIEWLDGQTVSPHVMEWALDFFLARQDEPYVLWALGKQQRRGIKITLGPCLPGGANLHT